MREQQVQAARRAYCEGALHVTYEGAVELEQRLRREIAQNPRLSFITVLQVTDHGVDPRDPYRWSVELRNAREGKATIYVRSLAHWRVDIKSDLMQSTVGD
jgi:hypothetical protein